jgi:hypothetical protein
MSAVGYSVRVVDAHVDMFHDLDSLVVLRREDMVIWCF